MFGKPLLAKAVRREESEGCGIKSLRRLDGVALHSKRTLGRGIQGVWVFVIARTRGE